MKSSIGATASRSQGSAGISMINKEYGKGYSIPVLPYQTCGMLCRALWPSRDQIIRIVPGYDPETGEVFRQNMNVNRFSVDGNYEEYLSDTFSKATVVSRFGSISMPILSDYAPGSDDDIKWAGNTVLHAFIRGISYACSPKTKRNRLKPINDWKIWTGPGSSNRIGYDKPALLMQALIFKCNGRDNQDYETGQPLVDENGSILPFMAVVVLDGKTSVANILQALVDPADPRKPLDASTNNKYGGVAELDGNKLYLNTYTDPTSGQAALRPAVSGPGEGWKYDMFPLSADVVRSLWIPWDKLLHYMTAQEQLELCATEFGADTVNYVIGTDPFFSSLEIPEPIKAAGLGRYADTHTTVAVRPAPQTGSMIGRGLGSSFQVGKLTNAAPGLMQKADKPAQAAKPITGIGSSIDISGMQAALASIRAASGKPAVPASNQAQEAQSLLGDDDNLQGLGD